MNFFSDIIHNCMVCLLYALTCGVLDELTEKIVSYSFHKHMADLQYEYEYVS